MRYAIDKKPTYYKSIRDNVVYRYDPQECDWREIIYQMALDYYKHHTDEDFKQRIITANPHLAPSGRTGYEQYYVDMQGFWRQLYDPNPDPILEEVPAENVREIFGPDDYKNLYVQDAYVPLTAEEREKLLNQFQMGAALDISMDELYVVQVNRLGNGKNKETFYPFIGSQVCCLTAKTTYFYANGNSLKSSADPQILNAQSLKSLYKDVNSTKKLVVDLSFEAALQNEELVLWKKNKNKAMLWSNLDAKCQLIYRGGIDMDGDFVQNLASWALADNYGGLSDKRENVERVVYMESNPNGDYINNHWHWSVAEMPEQLTFWIDFLDAEGSELFDNYCIASVGDRTKAVNDSNVKSMYYRDVPDIIFVKDLSDIEYDRKPGYTYIQRTAFLIWIFPADWQSGSGQVTPVFCCPFALAGILQNLLES